MQEGVTLSTLVAGSQEDEKFDKEFDELARFVAKEVIELTFKCSAEPMDIDDTKGVATKARYQMGRSDFLLSIENYVKAYLSD